MREKWCGEWIAGLRTVPAADAATGQQTPGNREPPLPKGQTKRKQQQTEQVSKR